MIPVGGVTFSLIHNVVKAAQRLPPALSPTNIIRFGMISNN
jgi:hypothetical protein